MNIVANTFLTSGIVDPWLLRSLIFQVWELGFKVVKGSLDEKLPIYEQDPKSKRLDSFEKRFGRD